MWLIARRSFAEGWARLIATMLAALFSVGLIAGSLQFALRAQEAMSGSDASEFSRADVLVQGGSADPDDVYAPPDGRVRTDRITGRPGVAAAAGDAAVYVTAAGRKGTIVPPGGARTLLRPWIGDPRLNPYKLESGRAPAADGEVAVLRHVARAGRLKTGSSMKVLLPRQTRDVKVVGVVTVQGHSSVAAGDLVLAPPETVRQAAGLPAGTWQSVWVKAAPGVTPQRLKRDLARDLGKDAVTVRTARSVQDAQSAELQGAGASVGGAIGMLASVAVFVGLFVVANTFGTLVRQRTRRLALLGAIGATPRQIKALIRLEALVLGVVASIGGVLFGYPVSAVLTALFARDGFDISAADAQFGWVALAVPAAAGVVVTQLAAWRAARRAARIAPMEALRATTAEAEGRRWPRLAGAFAVFACAWMFYGPVFAIRAEESGEDRTIGTMILILMGSMVTVSALAVLAPFFVGPLGGLVGRIGHAVSGEAGRLARATITRSPRRVSSAASSLMLGVALVSATALIVLSANARFDEAGTEVMRAEHAVTTTGKTSNGPVPLPRDTADKIARAPGVAKATALTASDAKLVSPPPRRPSPEEDPEPLHLSLTGADQAGLPSMMRLGGHLRPLGPGEIGVTSAIAKKQRLKRGQKIVVKGTRGRVTLSIAGVYHDPSHVFADGALVSPATMDRIDPDAETRAVLVHGGTARDLERAVAGVPGAKVMDRSAYVRQASRAMTNGLSVIYGFIGMSLVLALFGMATTVSMSVSERTREFGLLGAVGATAAQIRAIVRWEAATVVLLGTLLGLATAVGTVALMYAASGSSFLRPHAPWWLPVLVTAGAALVTLATSALPARRAAGVPVLEAAKAE